MFRSFTSFRVSCAVFLGAAMPFAQIHSGDMTENKSRSALDKWLGDKLQSSRIEIKPTIVPIEGKSVRQIFPDDTFYGVYFPRWPRVIPPPDELSSETIVRVGNEDFVEVIRGNDELRMFLARALSGVTNEAKAHASVEASLDLTAFASPNGPYKLQQPKISILREANGISASAHAAVLEPDRGEISVTIHFNAAGAAEADMIKIDSSTHPGSPPR